MTTRRIALPLLGSLFFCAGAASPTTSSEGPAEYQVKAAFLLNFIRFVEWPPDTFKTATDPLVVGILGKDPFNGALEKTVSDKTVDGRPVVIRRFSDTGAARACQVVFLAGQESRRLGDVTGASASQGVLIVGESDGFAERGGMINFIVQGDHVRFQINPSAAARVGLKISSKLLQLAVVVGEKGK
jgi:hypothetical protein